MSIIAMLKLSFCCQKCLNKLLHYHASVLGNSVSGSIHRSSPVRYSAAVKLTLIAGSEIPGQFSLIVARVVKRSLRTFSLLDHDKSLYESKTIELRHP